MMIGKASSFDTATFLAKLQNSRNTAGAVAAKNKQTQNAQSSLDNTTNKSKEHAQKLSADWLADMRANSGDKLAAQVLNLSEGDMKFAELRRDPAKYADAFLNGWNGQEPIGNSVFRHVLNEKGVVIPDGVKFDIAMNNFGKVTISGLDDAELAKKIEAALSYDSNIAHSVLGIFVQSAKILDGADINNARTFTPEQSRLIATQSDLAQYGSDLQNLRLSASGKILGLPPELDDKIYGDRTEWQKEMEPAQAFYENSQLDSLRDNIIHFLQNGTDHIPHPDFLLSYDSGRITVANVGTFNHAANSGVDVSV